MKKEEINFKRLENQIETGDIALSINDSFIAKGIRFFMNIYRIIKGLGKMELYNHSFHFIWVEEKLFVCEAIQEGGVLRPYKSAYFNTKIPHKIKKPVKSYTEDQKKDLFEYTIEFFGKNKEYNFMNFPYQILYILSGGKKWRGKKGKKAQKRIYCTETTATVINHVRKIWDRPWAANPLDIDLAEEYKDFVKINIKE